jgi:hypothetical protein
MLRQRSLRWLGIALAGLVVLSIGDRPSLRAGQTSREIANEPDDIIHPPTSHDDAKPPTVYLPHRPMSVAQLKVHLKLQEKHTIDFPNDTALEVVKKHIEEITKDKGDFPDGIPIYVNPQGLNDADKTMASTIAISIKGMPLATTLALLLNQLNLTYWVNKDGLLIITSNMTGDPTPDFLDGVILDNLESLRAEVRSLRDEIRAQRGRMP